LPLTCERASSIGLLKRHAATTPPARPYPSDPSRLPGVLGFVSEPAPGGPEARRSSVRARQAGSQTSRPALQEDRRHLVGAGGEPSPGSRDRG
jgi:hypothetical protein